MQTVAENYRKIRNTFRYILGNLYDFEPQRDAVGLEMMEALDQYILLVTADVVEKIEQWYASFEFHKVYQRLTNFCIVDLSAFYFDVLKDRLYTYAPKSQGRRAAQTAIWHIGEALVRLLAPILSFTCEEVWQHLPSSTDRPASVHLARFPQEGEALGRRGSVREFFSKTGSLAALGEGSPGTEVDWKILREVRDEVLRKLEEARNNKLIGGSLEAQVTIVAPENTYRVLSKIQDQLRYLFIVSAVTLEQAPSGNGAGAVKVQVSKADGRKCDRCWNYSTHVGEDPVYPTVCERCSAALKEIEAAATAR
jgi:isoleucyl-tRNA synthetase